MTEILLGVKRFPNPEPHKNPGGDCFACALKAAVDFLYPEKPLAFEDSWNCFLRETTSGEKHLSNVWPTMRAALYELHAKGYDLEIRQDLVLPSFDVDNRSHSWWHFEPEGEFAYRLEAWLSAGWVALVEMNLAGAGHFNQDGTENHIDHFAVLDGQRHFWQRLTTVPGASRLDHETHVVCSSKSGRGEHWVRTQDLLRKHGVAGMYLVRRDKREYR